MKTLLDLTCVRCNGTASVAGMSREAAMDVAKLHVCPDGVRFDISSFDSIRERIVPGPGERLRDTDERTR